MYAIRSYYGRITASGPGGGVAMTVARTIRKVWRANPTREGAGVHLKRAFGYHEVSYNFV